MPKIFIIVSLLLILLNLIAFILVAVDKNKSREDANRVPEVYFFFLAVFFASIGVLLGMYTFRHKTRKVYFPVGIGLLLVEQTLLTLYFLKLL